MITKLTGVVDRVKSWPAKWVAIVLLVVLSAAAFTLMPVVFAVGDEVDSSTKIVTFYDGDDEKTILTSGQTVADALNDAEITVDDNDIINPGVTTELDGGSMTVVTIKRARPVVVIDSNGATSRVITAETDKSTIAKLAGLPLKSSDVAAMSTASDFISSGGVGQKMEISRAKTVYLTLYGQKLTLRTQKSTVGELLVDKGISLADSDTLSVDSDAEISDGMSFDIWRNGVQTIEVTEDVAYETETVKDSTKKVGYSEVQTVGQNGKKTVIYQINIQNGVEVSREKISEVVTEPAVNEVVIEGTKVELPSGSYTDWMAMAGIPESDYGATNYIISHESGWRYNATNSSSGAYGLPQALPGSKMASAGSDWETNPITQLKWFYSYCVGRYGSVQGAYEFWTTNHWY